MSHIIKASRALRNVNVSMRSPFMRQKHDKSGNAMSEIYKNRRRRRGRRRRRKKMKKMKEKIKNKE